jgi:hypothetical protein
MRRSDQCGRSEFRVSLTDPLRNFRPTTLAPASRRERIGRRDRPGRIQEQHSERANLREKGRNLMDGIIQPCYSVGAFVLLQYLLRAK